MFNGNGAKTNKHAFLNQEYFTRLDKKVIKIR